MMVCSSCRGETRFDWRTHRWTHRGDSDHEIAPVVPVGEETDAEPVEPIPEPEIRATPKTVEDLAPRSGMRQIANLLVNEGWQLSISYARGPYMSRAGKLLSVSDSIVIRGVDNGRKIVGHWRDSKFDFAYIRVGKEGWHGASSSDLKTFIKEAP